MEVQSLITDFAFTAKNGKPGRCQVQILTDISEQVFVVISHSPYNKGVSIAESFDELKIQITARLLNGPMYESKHVRWFEYSASSPSRGEDFFLSEVFEEKLRSGKRALKWAGVSERIRYKLGLRLGHVMTPRLTMVK